MISDVDEDALHFLDGGGQMGAAIAAFDWSGTPLGPIGAWPAALKVAVGMMVNSAFPKCLCWGPELTTLYNDAFITILGAKHPCLGRPFSEIWSEAWGDIRPIAHRAMTGDATFIEDFPLQIKRSDRAEEAFFTFCYSPVRDENGTICGMLDTVVETTGKVRAERRAALRNRELIHRSRNAYALVSALVSQTCRTSATMEEAQRKIQERLTSLVRAQEILAASRRGDATVRQVVDETLYPFSSGTGTIEACGPEVRIDRDKVTSLALALHEMATNAAKYGALSTTGGHVSLTWRIEGEGEAARFVMDWRESGGPTPAPPARRGFGSFLIEEMLAREFEGEVEVCLPPEGKRIRLSTSAAQLA